MRGVRTDVAARKDANVPLARIEQHAALAASLLKALGNEQRLLVLCALLNGPRSVRQVNARVALSQSALSQHLAVLRRARIVKTRRESQTIWYELAPGPAQRVMEALYAAYCAPGAPSRESRISVPPRNSRSCT